MAAKKPDVSRPKQGGKDGKWKPGQSGNPAGRPPGRGLAAQVREKLGEGLPDVIAAVKAKALEGDIGACRLWLERVSPPIKSEELPVSIDIDGDTLTDRAECVMRALAGGDISPAQAAQLLTALGTLAKVHEVDELERRIAALEAAKGGNHGGA
jgi:hypothetical protein